MDFCVHSLKQGTLLRVRTRMKIVKIPRPIKVNPLVGTPRPTTKKDKQGFAEWMKANPTPSEALFLSTWYKCSTLKIQPQTVILGFIPDFYVKSKKVVIEIDGGIHASQIEYDKERDRIFYQNGFNVLRLTDAEVLLDPVASVMKAVTYIQQATRRMPDAKSSRKTKRKKASKK